jgi:hypothetical protein
LKPANILLVAMACGCTNIRVRHPSEDVPDGIATPVRDDKFRGELCSRPGPKWVTSSWEVSPQQVKQIDPALLSYMRTAFSWKTLAYKPEKYVRQYLGLRRGEHPFIYINAYIPFPRGAFEDPAKGLVIACDGGDAFWGIEYDLEWGTFSDLEVNGSPEPL